MTGPLGTGRGVQDVQGCCKGRRRDLIVSARWLPFTFSVRELRLVASSILFNRRRGLLALSRFRRPRLLSWPSALRPHGACRAVGREAAGQGDRPGSRVAATQDRPVGGFPSPTRPGLLTSSRGLVAFGYRAVFLV